MMDPKKALTAEDSENSGYGGVVRVRGQGMKTQDRNRR
jgi:hypothetical protein